METAASFEARFAPWSYPARWIIFFLQAGSGKLREEDADLRQRFPLFPGAA
jgi:hypothetical protein